MRWRILLVSGIRYNNHLTKGNKMATLEIGQTITTAKSGVVGVIKAVDNHPSGVARVLLDVNGSERWTSVEV